MAAKKQNCLFCHKSRSEVQQLIACEFEGVLICDECVGQAMLVLCAKGWVPPTVNIVRRFKLTGQEHSDG